MAEGVGFEPTAPFGVTGFQDQLLKPLEHPSIIETTEGKYTTLFYLKQLIKFSINLINLMTIKLGSSCTYTTQKLFRVV